MFQATELVYEALLRKDVKCRIREAGNMSLVEAGFSGRNFADVRLFFISILMATTWQCALRTW